MRQKIDTSIIIPAYNEEAIITTTLGKVSAFIKSHKAFLGECEVIVVAAGGGETGSLAKACSPLFTQFKVITPKDRVGKGRDVRLGFLEASGDVQLFMDADLSTPLAHIIPMIEKLRGGADVVIGTRKLSQIHKSPLRSMLSKASNLLTRAVILPGIRDTQCGFKGFRKEAAAQLFPQLTVMKWGFDMELLVLARESRLTIQQIPINDWHETREEEFRGDRISAAAYKTLFELARIRGAAWWRWCLRHAGLAPFIAFFAVFGLAFWVGPFRSIWFDEAYSVALIRQPLDQLIYFTSVDVHPPLYYMALKAWAFIFGESELALRSLSMVCGALASGVAVVLARYMFGARAALIALPFVVLSPFLLRYDIEARMYAMASLICITATYVLVRALSASDRRRKFALWAVYAILVAAGMYTQYYTALVWVVHFVWCLAVTGRQRPIWKTFAQPWLLAFVGAVVLYAPWIHSFLWQIGNVQNGFWIGPVTIREVLNVGTMFMSYRAQWQLDPMQSLATMVGLGLAIWLAASALRSLRATRERRYVSLLILYTILPIVLLYLASLPPLKPVFLDRYFSHILLAGYLLVGVSVALQASRRRAFFAGAALLVVLALGVGSLRQQGNFNFNTLSLSHTKEAVVYLKERLGAEDTIIVDSPGKYFEMDYYLPTANVFFYSKEKTSTSGGYAPLHDSSRRLASADQVTSRTVWYLHSEKEEPKLQLPDYKLVRTDVITGHQVSVYTRK
ncbi:MAG TPA: glycosyltransferase [Candidatus Saccharimonadales bacterium]